MSLMLTLLVLLATTAHLAYGMTVWILV